MFHSNICTQGGWSLRLNGSPEARTLLLCALTALAILTTFLSGSHAHGSDRRIDRHKT